MWIVRIALSRPYTFVVLALLILMVGPLTIARTPTDIFPNINIPVVAIVWNYGGLSADEMSNRIVSIYERNLTTTVNDIEHVESQSLRGIGVVKVFFQPGAKIELAVAQVTASSQSQLRQLPPGTQPPFILTYNASTVPVLQLALSGKALSEQQLFDIGVQLPADAAGDACRAPQIPFPYGGKQRADPGRPRSRGAAGQGPVAGRRGQRDQRAEPDPARPARRRSATTEYDVDLNASPRTIEELNDLPIKIVDGATDLHPRRRARAQRLPAADQHRPRRRPARGAADRSRRSATPRRSTSSRSVKDALPRDRWRACRRSSTIKPLADQSLFVRGVDRRACSARR